MPTFTVGEGQDPPGPAPARIRPAFQSDLVRAVRGPERFRGGVAPSAPPDSPPEDSPARGQQPLPAYQTASAPELSSGRHHGSAFVWCWWSDRTAVSSPRPVGGTVQTDIDPRRLIGRKAYDRKGAKIGTVDEVYLDDATGVPEWAAVRTGLFSRDAFVPLEPSEFVEDALRVPFDRALIKGARTSASAGTFRPNRNCSSTGITGWTPRPRRPRPPTTGTSAGWPARRSSQDSRGRAAADRRAAAAGRRSGRVRTRPGALHGSSNRTVTRPIPLPCTQPCPCSSWCTSCPAGPSARGELVGAVRLGLRNGLLRGRRVVLRSAARAPGHRRPGRTGPPGCSRRAP